MIDVAEDGIEKLRDIVFVLHPPANDAKYDPEKGTMPLAPVTTAAPPVVLHPESEPESKPSSITVSHACIRRLPPAATSGHIEIRVG